MAAEKQTAEKQRPADEVRYGRVKIAIWKRTAKEGHYFYVAGQPELSYKDDADGQWKASGSYSSNELGDLSIAVALAAQKLSNLNKDAHADQYKSDGDN